MSVPFPIKFLSRKSKEESFIQIIIFFCIYFLVHSCISESHRMDIGFNWFDFSHKLLCEIIQVLQFPRVSTPSQISMCRVSGQFYTFSQLRFDVLWRVTWVERKSLSIFWPPTFSGRNSSKQFCNGIIQYNHCLKYLFRVIQSCWVRNKNVQTFWSLIPLAKSELVKIQQIKSILSISTDKSVILLI